jgi:hypothetical protein
VQLGGRFGDDATILELMHQVSLEIVPLSEIAVPERRIAP